jgi:DNA-binding NarL/FixJ family response regulator
MVLPLSLRERTSMPTRVLIAVMPPILRQIVKDVIRADGRCEIEECVDPRADLQEEVSRRHVDAVVLRSAAPGSLWAWSELLRAHPHVRLLVLSRDGRTAFVHRVNADRTVLPDISPQELVHAVRGITRDPD